MVTVREDGFFHFRIQRTKEPLTAAGGDHLTGAMIALMPTEEDAHRLHLEGGETVADLHLTLYFLGEGEDWTEPERQRLTEAVSDQVSGSSIGPVVGRVFGVNHWNGGGENPCWVLAVGDAETDRPMLETARNAVGNALATIDDGTYSVLPSQHTPWSPHICMTYSDDISLAGELQARLGEVTFDRIRLAFAGDYTDIPLDDSLTAAAPPLRRNLSPLETSSRTDFVRMQSEWESAVDAAMADIAPIRTAQRDQISSAVLMAAETDDLDSLTSLTLDDEAMYSVLIGHMTRAANEAGLAQQEEAEEQGVDVPEWSLDNLSAAAGLDLLRSVARVTAQIINTSFVQSGIRRALSLVGRPAVSPEQASAEVNTHLEELSDAGPRQSIGGAITAAQNEGRRTVLSVAPPATEYVASEVLDQSVCGPCRSVDGESFGTLADAEEAYPSGGYRDCLGGDRCRGTIVAVWE